MLYTCTAPGSAVAAATLWYILTNTSESLRVTCSHGSVSTWCGVVTTVYCNRFAGLCGCAEEPAAAHAGAHQVVCAGCGVPHISSVNRGAQHYNCSKKAPVHPARAFSMLHAVRGAGFLHGASACVKPAFCTTLLRLIYQLLHVLQACFPGRYCSAAHCFVVM